MIELTALRRSQNVRSIVLPCIPGMYSTVQHDHRNSQQPLGKQASHWALTSTHAWCTMTGARDITAARRLNFDVPGGETRNRSVTKKHSNGEMMPSTLCWNSRLSGDVDVGRLTVPTTIFRPPSSRPPRAIEPHATCEPACCESAEPRTIARCRRLRAVARANKIRLSYTCLLYTSPSPRD